MSLFNRRALLSLPLVLCACGFTPVFAPGGAGAQLRGQVLVQEPSDQASFLLTRHMETRLGRSGGAARYALDLAVSTGQAGLAINPAGEITRFNLIGNARFALRDTTSGNVITSGTVDNFTAYSATGTTVAALAAEEDALERLMVILGDQITARLFSTDLAP
ncbi:MAG: LPS assembly lipoprotein LptE [Sulfitobacter sp.]